VASAARRWAQLRRARQAALDLREGGVQPKRGGVLFRIHPRLCAPRPARLVLRTANAAPVWRGGTPLENLETIWGGNREGTEPPGCSIPKTSITPGLLWPLPLPCVWSAQ